MPSTDRHYFALIHKDADSGFGVSFPDVPGIIAAAPTLDEAIAEAAFALDFAFEDWTGPLPTPRSLDDLRQDPTFVLDANGAVIAAIRPSANYYHAAE